MKDDRIDERGIIKEGVGTKHGTVLFYKDTGTAPSELALKLNLVMESNQDALTDWVKTAIAKYPAKVTEYRQGKTGLLGLFIGEVMKLSKGKADPKSTDKLVREMLEEK